MVHTFGPTLPDNPKSEPIVYATNFEPTWVMQPVYTNCLVWYQMLGIEQSVYTADILTVPAAGAVYTSRRISRQYAEFAQIVCTGAFRTPSGGRVRRGYAQRPRGFAHRPRWHVRSCEFDSHQAVASAQLRGLREYHQDWNCVHSLKRGAHTLKRRVHTLGRGAHTVRVGARATPSVRTRHAARHPPM